MIFLTSATVVTPRELFDWIHAHVLRSETAIERFQLFWGASWLLIVKGWHVTEFALLMLLSTWTLDAFLQQKVRRHVLIAGLLCTLYAASDEWHQTFVPHRGGVVSDVLIDTLGILLAGIPLLRRRQRVWSDSTADY